MSRSTIWDTILQQPDGGRPISGNRYRAIVPSTKLCNLIRYTLRATVRKAANWFDTLIASM